MAFIYLAGPSSELARVKEAARLIEDAGHKITERWWERIEKALSLGWRSDAEVSPSFMRESSGRNKRAIEESGFVVALARSEGGFSSGTAWEIGYASGLKWGNAPTIILVGDLRNFIGSFEADFAVSTVESALRVIG